MRDAIDQFLSSIERNLRAGNECEHKNRAALKRLVESFDKTIVATNEPRRVRCGAPDFVVTRGETPLGYIEAKDVGTCLETVEKSARMTRYRESLSNLILTDYLEFRWYLQGDHRETAVVAEIGSHNALEVNQTGKTRVSEVIQLFLNPAVPTLSSPKELAQRMAASCRMIRDSIRMAFNDEDNGGSLHEQIKSFRQVLLHDLTQDQFADMYAQTVSYGLFAARCQSDSGVGFSRQNAAYDLPKTNPFLRKMFSHIAGPDLDDRVAWIVDDLADLLRRADMGSVLEDFGKRNGAEDPVVHFYESFLAAYDPRMREMRGVYYTPEPVVSYIVRSVDHILRTAFKLKDGLADASKVKIKSLAQEKIEVHKVQILDPAVGTGTFLYRVIDRVYESFKGNEGMWSGYVSQHLLPRLWGFELLMAPYAVAHMKLAMQLRATGYDLSAGERLRVYLTNTLEEARELEMLPIFAQWLAEEANAANGVKLDVPVMVVLGNPPYSNFGMGNKGHWIQGLLNDYKKGLREKKLNLDDDFIKFMRFGQWRIDRVGMGIMALITSNTYLDGITHRLMRESLMETFSKIFILDLHGSARKRERSPQGIKDENVFDIRQSVAIGIFVKEPKKRGKTRVHYADMWGSRTQKYARLAESDVASTQWTELKDVDRKSCLGRFRFFTPKSFDYADEYCAGWSVKDIFPHNAGGIETQRDQVTVHHDAESLIQLLTSLQSDPVERFRNLYHVQPDGRDWTVARAKESVSRVDLGQFDPNRIQYRPFDVRYTWLNRESKGFIAYPRYGITRHMLAGDNLALCATHHVREDWNRHILVTNTCAGKDAVSSLDRCFMFPLYFSPADHEDFFFRSEALKNAMNWVDKIPRVLTGEVDVKSELDSIQELIPSLFPEKLPRWVNIHPVFIQEMVESLGLLFIPDGNGDLVTSFGPEDIFHYLYAVFHAPTYGDRYQEFLRIDFPRAQVTSDLALFKSLCGLGRALVELHTMTKGADVQTSYPIHGDNRVEGVRYSEPAPGAGPGRVWINRSQFFEEIPPDVWHFRIGGYQVCHKWLKDRKGRKLSYEDLTHYHRTVAAVAETIILMHTIDAVIDDHGGLPLR